MNSADSIVAELKRQADPKRLEGMAKFAVGGKNTLGVPVPAIRTAREVATHDSKSARWIAADALRELTAGAVTQRIKGK